MIVDKLRIFFDIDYKTGVEYWIPVGELKLRICFLLLHLVILSIEKSLIILLSMVNLVLLSLTGILN